MYIKTVMNFNPAMSQADAEKVVDWMRDNIFPTLDHLPAQAFSDALAECYVLGVI